MRTIYTDLDIKTTVDGMTFRILNIVFERFLRSMPRHSHGEDSYELHYIHHGHGKVSIGEMVYDISPRTLFMTGPHVEHEQIPIRNDPMAEYCIYFKLENPALANSLCKESIAAKFANVPFWYGKDSQDLYPTMQQLFFELEHKYIGYMMQVEALLQQCIVKTVRNYENKPHSKLHFLPSNLIDRKYIIVEECFLYEFESITLKSLSHRLALSTRQTERFLKGYYGKTFLQKKTEAKMSMAKIYLDDNQLNITEIANQLNYSTPQNFSNAFKQYFGVSAREYRKERLHSPSPN